MNGAPAPLLKAADVAKWLDCSKSTAYRLMQSGEIPSVKIGGLVRVRVEILERLIQSHEQAEARRHNGSNRG